ncbi:predicted protein [Uncinocarpus reesii 1704]|uniref:F-box domain-containing protein n=1 Tax=Uncinocarpus reesii (strain UAMH 1704) TaxID=336963 RepID=C4JKV7_UNCRE|nr:uncharacterized protein UREG_00172 [Uncinocarpus reesii 1704]EEP75326.1 predicted protein [Uncinocarpus reesii 1704]
MARTHRKMKGEVTYSWAREEETNILIALEYHPKPVKLFAHLRQNIPFIQQASAHHLGLHAHLCQVGDMKTWRPGSFNVCVPIVVGKCQSKRMLMRFPLLHRVGESFLHLSTSQQPQPHHSHCSTMDHPQPTALFSLPNELLDHILSFLSPNTSPSRHNLREIPDHNISASPTSDLKAVARTASRLRALSRPFLFAYSRYELRDQDRFLLFLQRYSLSHHVRSLVISVRSIFPGSEKAFWWRQLLEQVDPETITLIAPPFFLADIAQVSLEGTHAWAFDVPLQILHFRQPRRKRIPRMGSPAQPPTPPENPMSESFFTVRAWTEILFNEGSSLKAYRNYEYYLLRLPSLMDHWGSVDPLQNATLPYPVSVISRLTSFQYTSIFPFYNHTNLVLKVIRNMTNLRYLSFQLAPSLQNLRRVFSEEQEFGSLDPNDPWMELDTGYSLISHSVRYLGVQGKLERFRTWDFELEALKDGIVAKMNGRLRGRWRHDGTGLWVKDLSFQAAAADAESD